MQTIMDETEQTKTIVANQRAYEVPADVADLFKRLEQSINVHILMEADLRKERDELQAALKRAVPWLGKLIADKGHLQSVAPNDAIGALQQAEAALKGKP